MNLLDKIRKDNKLIIIIAVIIYLIWLLIFYYPHTTFSEIKDGIIAAFAFGIIIIIIWKLMPSQQIKIINQYNQEMLEFAKNNHLHHLQQNEVINPYKNKISNKEIFNFKKSNKLTIYNFIWGDYQNKKVQIYNYQFLLDNPLFPNKNTMVEVEIPEIDKHLILRPEHTLQEDHFDINIESVEFNKMYHIISKDPRFAYSVLDPLFMQELMKHREFRFEVSENSLLVYAKNEISIEKIQEMLNLGITLTKILEKNL